MTEFENQVLDAYRNGNRFGEHLGMDFKIIDRGKVHYNLTISETHLATPSAAHGGVIAAFMDAILGVGALSASSTHGNVVSTVEFKISYLKPALLNDTLIGKSRLLKEGKSLIFMDAEVWNQRDELVATGSGTFNQYSVQKLISFFDK